MTAATVTIHPISDVAGCRHLQTVQRLIWQGDDLDLLPIPMLVTFVENGALVLGATAADGPAETGGLVGFLIGWLGTSPQGQLKHCSTVAGVLPGWRGRGLGLRLKLAQRQAVLAQGLTDQVTWTYDPLNVANGRLNLHRLGGLCTGYVRNLYGNLNNALNVGLPSDRCQVTWHVRSERVEQALAGAPPEPWRANEMQLLGTAHGPDGLLRPQLVRPRFDGQPLALPLPNDVPAMRQRDSALLLAWRLFMREVLEAAFAAGYALVDCVELGNAREWYYILSPRPESQ